MKLDEAIKILEIEEASDFQGITYDFEDAIKLGIEALKEIHRERIGEIPFIGDLLPGETPQIDTNPSLHHIKEVRESPEVRK